MQPTTGASRLGKPSKHRAEIRARDVNQAGACPDPVAQHAGTLRVGQIIGQRIQVCSAGAKQEVAEVSAGLGRNEEWATQASRTVCLEYMILTRRKRRERVPTPRRAELLPMRM